MAAPEQGAFRVSISLPIISLFGFSAGSSGPAGIAGSIGSSLAAQAQLLDPVDWEQVAIIAGRLCLAVLLGSLVGIERALRDKPAGFRTNVLICVGACVFTISSMALSEPMVDKTRIAAQIVSGVGFLGAGAILRDAKSVIGLTTAATIWALAAIGMACGFGEIVLAIAGTGFILSVLVLFPALGRAIELGRAVEEYRLSTARAPERIDEIEVLLSESNLKLVVSEIFEEEDNLVFSIRALGPYDDHRRFRRKMLLNREWRLCEVH